MAKKKPPADGAQKRYPSRENTKYVGLPLDLWRRLKAYADQDERSVNWMARKAIREFLERVDLPPDPRG